MLPTGFPGQLVGTARRQSLFEKGFHCDRLYAVAMDFWRHTVERVELWIERDVSRGDRVALNVNPTFSNPRKFHRCHGN